MITCTVSAVEHSGIALDSALASADADQMGLRESSPRIPARIGRYEVLAHLATGGMAQLYLARQTGIAAFERHVALKTILPQHTADPSFVAMFLDEARLAATLNHQNIAQVYEVGEADGAYFMAMEYVHGENARALLGRAQRLRSPVPLELALSIVSGAAAGLHHAHNRLGKTGQPLNIVHRDMSPGNIMIGYDGSVKVLDFGIAKAEERATKTAAGSIKGKYGYMSPEQCMGKPVDRRSDIFALGICLYELTTVRRAFKASSDFETLGRIVKGDFVRPTAAKHDYPAELEQIVVTAMATDVDARFSDAQQMLEALEHFATRAKLTMTSTGLARFMIQMFGNKAEPWVAPRSETSLPAAIPLAEQDTTAPATGSATHDAPTIIAAAASCLDEIANRDLEDTAKDIKTLVSAGSGPVRASLAEYYMLVESPKLAEPAEPPSDTPVAAGERPPSKAADGSTRILKQAWMVLAIMLLVALVLGVCLTSC